MDPNLLMQVVSARVLSDDGASNQLTASSDDGVQDLTLFPSSTSPAGGSLEKPAIASNGVGITSKAPLPTAATSLLAAMADAHLYAQMLPSSSTGVNMFAASVHHATKYSQPQPLQVLARNSTKTLKCPKCNWHYKYQETLEIHMKEKHFEGEVNCLYCTQNQPHPKLARGESYSCGYKPYRCDLCKYSTTTKGNLSIHMQSDKHLNALNDLLSAPTYDQVFKTGATGFDISPNVVGLDGAKFIVNGADGDRDEFRDANDNPSVNADHFHCLICSKFRCSDPQKMMEHLKKDRSFTHLNDIQVSPSSFYCNLCPYGTNLKANFQLHTRTDKHLQRVQLVNHMREGWSSTSNKDVAVSMLSRLSTVKSVVQVRCHLCQETFLCHTTLHEHINSTTHSIRALLVDDSGSVNHIAAVGRSNTPSSGFSTQQLREIFDKLLADRRRFGSTLFTDNLMGYESDTDNSPMITTEHNISMSSSSFTIVDVTVDSQLAYRCIPCAAVCYSTDEANEHLITHPEANQQNNEVPSSNVLIESDILLISARQRLQFSPIFTWNVLNERLLKMKEARFLCTKCEYSTDQRTDFEKHTTTVGLCDFARQNNKMALNDKFSSTNGPNQDDKSFNTCSECGMAFEMSSRLSQHLLQHSSVPLGLEQRCPIADENCTELTFSAFTELSDHLEKKHPLWSIKRRTIDDTNGNKHSTPEPSTSKTCMQEICALNDDNKQRQRSQWYRNSLNNNNNSYAAGENLDDFFIDRDNHNGNDSDNDNEHNLPALRNKLLRDTLAALARSDFGLNLSMLMNGNANISGDLSNARMFKCGADLWRMIEGDATVGKLRLLDEFADYKTSIENISSESLATVLASKCHSCNFLASDIWTLREHAEKVHGQNFLDESIIEQMINRLNDAISQTSDTKHHNNNGELKRKRESRSSSAESVSRKRGRVGSPDTVAVEPAATNDLLEAQQSLTKILMSNFFAESMKSAAQNNSISYLSNITSDGTLSSVYAAQKNLSPNSATSSTAYDTGNSPAKRARTRITDEQLKILRQYFDINNSPSEEKIKEMSVKAQLPEKVIKHWFRNTLFKERQRDKDSPYNFSIPPQMSIDLAVYEKTGEAKITPIEQQLKAENLNSSVDGSCSIAKTEDPVKKSPSEELSDVSANESAAVSPFAEKLLDSRSQSVAYENGDYDIDKSDNRTPQIRNYEDFVAELTRISGLSDSATGSAEDGSELNQEQPPSLNFTTLLNGLAGTDPAALSAMLANSVMSSCVPNLLMIPPDLTATASINNVSSSANLSDTRITSPTVAQGAISCGSTAGLTVGSGRRANRTRFTDFQLRTLQNFFDRQAYPKDDDLEMLSKKLGLSPRVIVVWFQNARQKARKISENHGAGVVLPAGAGGGGTLRDGCLSMLMEGIDETDSLVSLPPFQCRKCATVFPLHVDLVQHYQKGCFGAENSLLLGDRRDNTPTGSGVNMFLNPFLDGFLTASKTTKTAGSPANSVNRNDTRESEDGPSPAGSQQPTVSTSEGEEGETERMLQYFLKMIGQTNGNSFYTMQSFINDNGNNAKATNDKIDSKNVGGRTSPLDLSVSTINGGGRFSPNNNDVELMTIGDDSDNLSRTVSTSPYAPPTSSSNLAQMSDLFSQFVQQQRQQSQQLKDGSYGDSAVAACAAAAAAAAANNSKRYRTHLTPLQVYIMKALFNDYKTPSMSECDALGHQIGLHKRVVQVWFQNARAKERKSRGGLLGVDASAVDDVAAVNLATGEGAATRCELCEIDLADASIQDHIFTSAHIQRVRTQGVLIRAAEGTSDKPLAEPIRPGSAKSGQRPYSPTSKPNTSFSFSKWPYKSTPNLSAESFFDHNLMGTPIVMLQIPESVMRQISADLASGRGAAHFTQDGLELAQLRGKISEDDFKQTTTVESEVGWACPECMNVFQHESLLQNHQRIVCQNSSGIFRLVQTHYLCKSCSCKTGTQDEFRAHCKSNFHVAAKRNEIQSTGYVATTAKPTPT